MAAEIDFYLSLNAFLYCVQYGAWKLASTKQASQISCLAQTSFAAFGKGVELISGPPFAKIEQLSRLTSSSGILSTSWW